MCKSCYSAFKFKIYLSNHIYFMTNKFIGQKHPIRRQCVPLLSPKFPYIMLGPWRAREAAQVYMTYGIADNQYRVRGKSETQQFWKDSALIKHSWRHRWCFHLSRYSSWLSLCTRRDTLPEHSRYRSWLDRLSAHQARVRSRRSHWQLDHRCHPVDKSYPKQGWAIEK